VTNLDDFKRLQHEATALDLIALEPLWRHTSFKVGGPAGLFGRAKDLKHLISILNFANSKGLPIFLLGSGSNVLFPDEGYPGLVLKLVKGEFEELVISGERENKNQTTDDGGIEINVGAGVTLGKLLKTTTENSLGGLEDLIGIPGTLGGAIMMNAGAGTQTIGERVTSILILNTQTLKSERILRKELEFSYRNMKTKIPSPIILSATLNLDFRKEREKLERRIKERLRERKERLPQEPSAGSFFKNPPGNFAGKLIEECGFKGFIKGGAMVSLKHANVIVNFKDALAKDILELSDMIEKGVRERFGISLEREVRVVRP
jgi:UDP-N-acetylmuramate dehydrogenase